MTTLQHFQPRPWVSSRQTSQRFGTSGDRETTGTSEIEPASDRLSSTGSNHPSEAQPKKKTPILEKKVPMLSSGLLISGIYTVIAGMNAIAPSVFKHITVTMQRNMGIGLAAFGAVKIATSALIYWQSKQKSAGQNPPETEISERSRNEDLDSPV